MRKESSIKARGMWKKLLIGVAATIVCLCMEFGNVAQVQAQESTPTKPAPTEAKKPNPEEAKPPAGGPAASSVKTPETNPPTQAKTSTESKLEVVKAEEQTIWDLVEGRTKRITLQVTTDAADGLNLAHLAFAPIDAKNAPAEAAQVRIEGPAQGYPGVLKSGETMEISLVFPPHRSIAKYAANLTYTTPEAPNQPLAFHTATVDVGMMDRLAAGIIAGGFCLVIILLTFLVAWISKSQFNFFQSPDGGYSVSKFQIWIWTLVIVFSYSYLFLWRDGDIALTANTWALLGISVASTGIAKVIAVTKDEGKGGGVATTSTPPPAPDAGGGGAVAAGAVAAVLKAVRPDWLTSMLSDSGQLSLMRIQMFAWTMVTATMYVIYLFKQQALWDVPAGLLVLMGISHSGYLVDKGAAPTTDMKCESIQPNSIKADGNTHKNTQTSIAILGQNFRPSDVKCFVGGVALNPAGTSTATRLDLTLPAQSLDGGKKYDVVVQQPGENSEVMTAAFEVTA